MNIALNRSDWQQANEIFSTALVANLILIAVQAPLFALAIWKLEWIIDVPPNLLADFRILVICNVSVFFLSLIKGIIFVPIYAANRIDIIEKFEMAGQALRLVLLILLIIFVGPYLWIIGVVELGIALLAGAVGFVFYKKLVQHQLKLRKRYINSKWIKPILNMAGWGIVANLGQMFFQKTDVWIVNRFVSMELAGVCAALLLWPNFVQQIAKSVTSLIMPAIIIDYAHERIERICNAVLLLSKFYAILSLLLLGGAMCFGAMALDLWMGSYSQYHLYLILMLVHFPLTLPREAMWSIFPAFDKMEYLGISNIVSGVLNIAASLVAVWLGYGLAGVIVATGLSLILQRTLFLTYFTAKLLKLRKSEFAKIYFPGTVILIAFLLQWTLLGNGYVGWVGMFSLILGGIYGFKVLIHDHMFKALFSAIRNSVSTRR